MLPTLRKVNKDYEEFKDVINNNTLLEGIDNQPDMDNDEVHAISTKLWLEVMNENNNKGSNEVFVSFTNYLELIKQGAKGFAYKLATDDNGVMKAFVVQTAKMRADYERFGKYHCHEMMGRDITWLLWNYVSVSIYNEMNVLCLGCEGIMCWERKEAYQFVTDFLSRNSPGLPKEDVKVVTGDGFFNQEMITHDFGFTNAKYISDWFHLFD